MADRKTAPKVNRCIHCGHELPEGASFCPYCEKEQVEAVALQAPRRKRRLILVIVFAAIAASIIGFLIWRDHQPKVYRGDSFVQYPLGKDSVEVIVSFTGSSAEDGHHDPEITLSIGEGDESAYPLWLCAYNAEDPSLAKKFAGQIESCSIEPVPVMEDGAGSSAKNSSMETGSSQDTESSAENTGSAHLPTPVTIFGPEPVADPSLAALWSADMLYRAENGVNELRWTINMKNKDKICLSQKVNCRPIPVKNLYYADTPLETTADIEAAIASVTDDTILNLYLPPVTYTEPLILSGRTVNLHGSADEKQTTTFTAGVEVYNRIPELMELYDITFEGNGGTAILAYEGVMSTHCIFKGWDVGVDAAEGSWPIIDSCTFEDNGIGLRFNSSSSTNSCDGCYGSVFKNNKIAAYIMQVPADLPFEFPDCTFEGNGEDIKK